MLRQGIWRTSGCIGLMQAKGWRWAAWRHGGGKGAADHKIRMLESLWRRGWPLCGNKEVVVIVC